MAAAVSNFLGNAVLQNIFTAPGAWLAMHNADPGPTGDPTTEWAAGGYARQFVTFSSPGSKSVVSTNGQLFSGLTAGSLLWLGLWNAVSGGGFLMSIPVTPPIIITASGQLRLAAGDIGIQL